MSMLHTFTVHKEDWTAALEMPQNKNFAQLVCIDFQNIFATYKEFWKLYLAQAPLKSFFLIDQK
jgi:hypothetical protein